MIQEHDKNGKILKNTLLITISSKRTVFAFFFFIWIEVRRHIYEIHSTDQTNTIERYFFQKINTAFANMVDVFYLLSHGRQIALSTSPCKIIVIGAIYFSSQ